MRPFVAILLACVFSPASLGQVYAPASSCPDGQCPLVAVPPGAIGVGQQNAPGSLKVDARAIVRITNTRDSIRTFGTGTLVDADADGGLILTCAHLFRETPDRLSVTFADGRVFDARLLKIDSAADLAALAIGAPGVEPIEIAQESPQRGDLLVSCGYGGDGRLWCNRGQALGYVTTLGSTGTETLELTGAARFGDSGGPVLDRNHHLAAVLFGTNGRVVDGTFCGRIRRFLAGLSARFRARPHFAPRVNPTPLPGPVDDGAARAQRPPDPPTSAKLTPPEDGQKNRDPSTGAEKLPSVQSPKVEQPPDVDPIGRAADSLGAVAEPWISARLAALLMSLGVPAGISGVAAAAGVWLVMRRGKKRLQGQLNRLKQRLGDAASPADSDNQGSALDPAVVERHHNRYVAYETTALDKAWAAAHAHVGEKYPGAIPYLKIAEGVKDQLLAGNTDPQLS